MGNFENAGNGASVIFEDSEGSGVCLVEEEGWLREVDFKNDDNGVVLCSKTVEGFFVENATDSVKGLLCRVVGSSSSSSLGFSFRGYLVACSIFIVERTVAKELIIP